MALDDLLRCRSYARKMLELPIGESFTDERTIYEALFVALIVSYGRVFMSSNTTEKEFKDVVSNSFGTFRSQVVKDLDKNSQKFHERLMEKRHTAIAHSDASSRNYQHYNDSPLGIGRNPYYPYEHDEVEQVMLLIENLIGEVGNKQNEVAKVAFKNSLFQSV
jgi:hypothetical protein